MSEPDRVQHLGAHVTGPLPEGRMEAPEEVFIAEVRWSPESDTDPECFAHRDPAVLMREVATIVHGELHGSPLYEGAGDFLDSHLPPDQWDSLLTVVKWLRDLAHTTDYPSVTIKAARMALIVTDTPDTPRRDLRAEPSLDDGAGELTADEGPNDAGRSRGGRSGPDAPGLT